MLVPCCVVLAPGPPPLRLTALQDDDILLAYEEEPHQAPTGAVEKQNVKGSYVSMHSSGFRDFLLKAELLKAISDCGFEHPSEGKRARSNAPTLTPLQCSTSAFRRPSSVRM